MGEGEIVDRTRKFMMLFKNVGGGRTEDVFVGKDRSFVDYQVRLIVAHTRRYWSYLGLEPTAMVVKGQVEAE